jgi:hypothetical protein
MLRSMSLVACVSTALTLAVVTGATGCGSKQGRAEISENAQLVAEGNDRISYTAPRDGVVWVFNRLNGNMEYAARVAQNDEVVVDPTRDCITLNGRVVNNKPMTTLDEKRIFFEPDAFIVGERRWHVPE